MDIKNFATVGSSLQKGWVMSIPDQYEKNKVQGTTTIIMDGGGNDVFSIKSDCTMVNDNCKTTLDLITLILKDLFAQMRSDGVEYIIYTGVYEITGLEQAIDYGCTKIGDVCKISEKCYFVDMRNETINTGWDGVHPTNEGFVKIANRIWETKLDYNIPF